MDEKDKILPHTNKADNILAIEHLTKRFGDFKAVDDISLSVNKGEIFGCIGPDGSGKTTLFRILVTLLLPDTGRAEVQGMDVVKDAIESSGGKIGVKTKRGKGCQFKISVSKSSSCFIISELRKSIVYFIDIFSLL